MILQVKEPKYSTKEVILAKWKCPKEGRVEFDILFGVYKGKYYAEHDDVWGSEVKKVRGKNGQMHEMFYVPMSCIHERE